MKFSRDSFDKFGDDLCEVILSYLPLCDCFEYQCVSKQFNALIFNKQTKLVVIISNNDNRIKNIAFKDNMLPLFKIDNKRFDRVLKKLVNINSIEIIDDIFLNDATLNIISDSGKQLKKLTLRAHVYGLRQIHLYCWKRLAVQCLQSLESLDINLNVNEKPVAVLMRFTLNLKTLFCQDFGSTDFGSVDIKLWPKLETVSYKHPNNQIIELLADHMCHQLKCLYIEHCSLMADISSAILKHLTRFQKLETLGFSIRCPYEGNYNYKGCIQAIGSECKNIKRLKLVGIETPFDDISGGGFSNLEKLCVGNSSYNLCENIGLLKNCRKLSDLRLNQMAIFEDSLKDIHTYLPQLKTIVLRNCFYMDGNNASEVLQHLSLLPNLCVREITDFKGLYPTTEDIDYFISVCPTIQRITTNDKCFNTRSLQTFNSTANRKVHLKTSAV